MAAYCSCCGAEIKLKAEPCKVCGAPQHGGVPTKPQGPAPSSKSSVKYPLAS